MKKYLLAFFIIAFLFTTNTFAQDKKFGLGIMGGDPTGINAKFWLTDTIAADAGFGYSVIGDNGFQIHSDVLYHLFEVISVSKGQMPIYLGVGGRVKFQDNDNRFGIRFPIGVAYIFDKMPLDVFVEPAPILDLAPSTKFGFNGVVGMRYFF